MHIALFAGLVAAPIALVGANAEGTMPPCASFILDSAVLKEARHINVYLPPAYDRRADARYPVMYMPDGGTQEDFPHVAIDVDRAIRSGEMRPTIVVGIENTQRRRDMTPYTRVESDRKIAPHVGGAAQFRRFLAEELMPDVRRRYRTNGKTAIVGESLAGLFVMDTFFAQPKLFDTYIALSPSLWWNHEALAHGAAARLQRWPDLERTLYIASANDDTLGDAFQVLRNALQSVAPPGLTWYYEPRTDLHHEDIYRRLSPSVFRRLFPAERQHGP